MKRAKGASKEGLFAMTRCTNILIVYGRRGGGEDWTWCKTNGMCLCLFVPQAGFCYNLAPLVGLET